MGIEVTTEINQIEDLYRQVRAAHQVLSQIRNCYRACSQFKSLVDRLQADRDYDLIPTNLKAACVNHYQIFNAARLDCEADDDHNRIMG